MSPPLLRFSTHVTGRIGGANSESNALWTPFAENGLDGTIMNNLHGGYSDINPSACALLNGGRSITNASVAAFALVEAALHHTSVPLATVGGDVCWINATSEYPPYVGTYAITPLPPALTHYICVLRYDQAIYATNHNISAGVRVHYSSPRRWAAALEASNESIKVMGGPDEFPYGDW